MNEYVPPSSQAPTVRLIGLGHEREYDIRFPRNAALLARVRSLPIRRFHAGTSSWRAPFVIETYEALRLQGWALDGLPRPDTSAVQVLKKARSLVLAVHVALLKKEPFPDRVDPIKRDGEILYRRVTPSRENVEHILAHWPSATWSERALRIRENVLGDFHRQLEDASTRMSGPIVDPAGYAFRPDAPPPFEAQRRALSLSHDREYFALLMEQGTGKTRVLIDNVCWLWQRGLVNVVLVICPNSVKDVWVDEVPRWSPPDVAHELLRWPLPRRVEETLSSPAEEGRITWLVVNVEALSGGRGERACREFLRANPNCVLIVDEATRIKTPRTRRTKAALKLAPFARFRRIATGTPVTQSPLDLFAPFKLLDARVLGFSSWYAMRAHHAIMGGFKGKQVEEYVHLDELTAKIAPHSFRVTRDEVLDLPPKQYQRLYVELTTAQKKAYAELRKDCIARLSEHERVTVRLIITQRLRLHQLAGGFLPTEEGGTFAFSPNPKIAALRELAEDLPRDRKLIVWAHFKAEIRAAADALSEVADVVELHGGVNERDRGPSVRAFQEDPDVRFLVGHARSGGIGVTLTAASYVVYLSSDGSYEARVQSEDRTQRAGQSRSVVYVDVLARDTVDEKILTDLRERREVANIVTGDSWKEWL